MTIDRVGRDAQSLGEMRTHIGVLQRAMEMLERSAVSLARAEIRYSAAVPDLILHNLLFTHLDYAAIGYRS